MTMATKTLIIVAESLFKHGNRGLRPMTSCFRWHSNSWNKVLLGRKYPAVCTFPSYQDKHQSWHANTTKHSDPFQRNFHLYVHFCQREESASTIRNPRSTLKVEESRTEEAIQEIEESIIPTKDETGKPLSNWARMKIMMKTYGYVVIPVHWVIAPVWFGGFYYAIKLGIDIEPILTKIGVSDHHVETLKNSKASTALMAYALYKIFTPLRYTVTLGATEVTIRALRRRGFIKPTPPKEKTYRQSLKDTVDGVKDRLNKDKN